MIKIGDYVTRNSYHNDIIFRVVDIQGDNCFLSGTCVRLSADSPMQDLVLCDKEIDDDDFAMELNEYKTLDRHEYFYLPGRVLHIDTDIQLSNKAPNPYKIRENTNFKKYKKSQKKQKISNFS